MDNDSIPLSDLVQYAEVSKGTIYRWIKVGKLNSVKNKGKILIIRDDKFSSLVSEIVKKKYDEKPKPYFPVELNGYQNWHDLIDNLTWLLKICYTSKEGIQKKKFNARAIFESYLRSNNIDLKKIKNQFAADATRKKLIVDDLKRGWYNELAFIYPLKSATLGVSFREIGKNISESSLRFTFPSWKITECYYASYFYLRSITLAKNSSFRIEEHKSTLNSFKNSALSILKKTVWKFPFDIEFKTGTRFNIKNTLIDKLPHLKNKYSNHPRTPNYKPSELTKKVYEGFKKRTKRFKGPVHYTLFDFLLEFRIWANYLDIDNLLNLRGEGYKGYLDQNLSLILFFIGGLTEIIFIANFGQEEYIKQLQNLYDLFATNNTELKDNFIYSSPYQRMKIYKLMGLTDKEIIIDSIINENEIN